MANMTNTATHLFDNYDSAASAVRELEAAGVPSSDISIVANRGEDVDAPSSGAATGATVGGALGAGAGLLAGLGMMAIPGIGPVVAAGWLAATAAGAVAGVATGGIIGSLTDLGVDEDDAHVYAEGMRRGGTLVSVKSTVLPQSTLSSIMNKHLPVDVAQRGDEYRKDGWSRFSDREAEITAHQRDRR